MGARGSVITLWVELGLKEFLWGTGQGWGALVPWWWQESLSSVAASAVTASKHGTRWQKLLPFLLPALLLHARGSCVLSCHLPRAAGERQGSGRPLAVPGSLPACAGSAETCMSHQHTANCLEQEQSGMEQSLEWVSPCRNTLRCGTARSPAQHAMRLLWAQLRLDTMKSKGSALMLLRIQGRALLCGA